MASTIALDDRECADSVSEEMLLIQKAKKDPEALSRLYRRHYAAISQHVRRRIGDAHQADDIVGEVFLTMVRELPKYRCRGIPFRVWLYKLATTQICRWARKQRFVFTLKEMNDVADTRSDDASDDAELDGIRGALLNLPEKYQNVISLYYLEGVPVSDIARLLRRPEGTIKTWLRRGREQLRNRLEK